MNELNEKLTDVLLQWDPFGYGENAYETEIVDVIQAAYEIDDAKFLAKRIKFIYEFSFEEIVPLKDCLKMAEEILSLKNVISCARN
jgi:hypothetical protein